MSKKPEIKISKSTANKLIAIVNDFSVRRFGATFDQDNCETCMIGHGIANGVMNGFTESTGDFNAAIKWLGLPENCLERGSVGYYHGFNSDAEAYLFGLSSDIDRTAKHLQLTNGKKHGQDNEYTAGDGVRRIEALLDRAGYDVC